MAAGGQERKPGGDEVGRAPNTGCSPRPRTARSAAAPGSLPRSRFAPAHRETAGGLPTSTPTKRCGLKKACRLAAYQKLAQPMSQSTPPTGPVQTRARPAAIQNIQILVVIPAGGRTHAPFKLQLVTIAQRGYSLGLLGVYGTKLAGRRFLIRAARPSYALRDSVPEAMSQGSKPLQQ